MNFYYLKLFSRKSFLITLSLGYPEILKINSVLNLVDKLKSVKGSEVIKCNIILFGFVFLK